ncbi:MAG TPA: indole-3-glycerol-phosphate synthase TrpC, partial [Saprospiraceae bacterium]|nr:indole-3-glycerol-phosphate synthase TrpC [Saprospiraceae bacterium]
MDILEQIVETKKKHVADCQAIYPVAFLEKSIYFPTKPVSLSRYILRDDKVGIIAEIKRKSPSKGIFKSELDLERLSVGYMQ